MENPCIGLAGETHPDRVRIGANIDPILIIDHIVIIYIKLGFVEPTPCAGIDFMNDGIPSTGTGRGGWNGCLTLPRILTLNHDKRLKFNPAPELQILRDSPGKI